MPGIPTKFVIADLVVKRLRAAGRAESKVLDDPGNLPYFYLGAIGADLGDFMAARPEVADKPPNGKSFEIWRKVLVLFSGTPAIGAVPGTTGIYNDLKQIHATVGKLEGIVNKAVGANPIQKDIQKIALLGMIDELNGLSPFIADIQATLAGVAALRISLGTAIFTSRPAPKVAPGSAWQARDTLHGSHTGQFLRALKESAGDDRQNAYALGATIGYAADLCGSPFVNSVVGAPYRNHWWRHRWIGNYIDTWVHGFYAQGGAEKVFIGDAGIPAPLYTNWPNVCQAALHKKIELPGLSPDGMLAAVRDSNPVPSVLDASFVTYWLKAYELAYGPPASDGGVDGPGLQSAFAMTWLILWLQTSGEAIPCVPGDQINYPDDCGAVPPWVAADGSITTGNGTVTPAPQASQDTDPGVAEVISGIALLLLAASAYAASMVIAAAEALLAAAVLVADGLTDPDWDALRCYVGWMNAHLSNLTNTMHDLLSWSGLGFPYTLALAHNDIEFTFSGVVSPADAALITARSRGRMPLVSAVPTLEPASVWQGPVSRQSNWANLPTEALELPQEFAYPTPPTWPFHFVDGLQPQFAPQTVPPTPRRLDVPRQVNPLNAPQFSRPLVRDPVQFGIRQGMLGVPGAIGMFFGNAVDVSFELITDALPSDYLNWDLDGDRGIGFPTWTLPTPSSPPGAAISEP